MSALTLQETSDGRRIFSIETDLTKEQISDVISTIQNREANSTQEVQLKQKKEKKIPNWTIFGAQSIIIDITRHTIDNNYVYNPMITIFLDGNQKHEYVTTIITEIYEDDLSEALDAVIQGSMMLFGSICPIVSVYDEDDNKIDEIDLMEDCEDCQKCGQEC